MAVTGTPPSTHSRYFMSIFRTSCPDIHFLLRQAARQAERPIHPTRLAAHSFTVFLGWHCRTRISCCFQPINQSLGVQFYVLLVGETWVAYTKSQPSSIMIRRQCLKRGGGGGEGRAVIVCSGRRLEGEKARKTVVVYTEYCTSDVESKMANFPHSTHPPQYVT